MLPKADAVCLLPEIHALDQMLRHKSVVIGKEDYAGSSFRTAIKLKPLPDHFLPLGVLGMGLASEHKLNRTLLIRENIQKP